MAWRAARASGPLVIAAVVAIALVSLAAAPAARAQEPPVTLPAEALTETMPPDLPPRPHMSVAVGMGATLDSTGFSDGAHAIPSFFGVGGFGDGLAGFDLGAFASSASGRYVAAQDAPVDRLALDAFGVIRPAARVHRDDRRYGYRVLHTLAAELGLGVERDGRSMVSGTRFVVHTGARVEFPLTPAGLPSELRLRLAMRRAIGLYACHATGDTTECGLRVTPEVAVAQGSTQTTAVGDSTELYAALAVVF
jgi:hypothetical protein